MFGELKLDTYQVEVVLQDFLVRADFHPRGTVLTYLNDRSRPYIPFENADLFPLAADRQVGGLKQSGIITLNKSTILLLSILKGDQAEKVQVLAAKRPAILYAGFFAIQGQLHVNQDALNEDVLEETKEFFALSQASVFPLRPVASAPTRQVPLLLISRHAVQAYHAG
jgi:hypothetical protein